MSNQAPSNKQPDMLGNPMPGYPEGLYPRYPVTVSGTNGRWSKEEHSLYLKGLGLYGKEWKLISQLVGTRTPAQIRSHAQKYFTKLAKRMNSDPTVSETTKRDILAIFGDGISDVSSRDGSSLSEHFMINKEDVIQCQIDWMLIFLLQHLREINNHLAELDKPSIWESFKPHDAVIVSTFDHIYANKNIPVEEKRNIASYILYLFRPYDNEHIKEFKTKYADFLSGITPNQHIPFPSLNYPNSLLEIASTASVRANTPHTKTERNTQTDNSSVKSSSLSDEEEGVDEKDKTVSQALSRLLDAADIPLLSTPTLSKQTTVENTVPNVAPVSREPITPKTISSPVTKTSEINLADEDSESISEMPTIAGAMDETSSGTLSHVTETHAVGSPLSSTPTNETHHPLLQTEQDKQVLDILCNMRTMGNMHHRPIPYVHRPVTRSLTVPHPHVPPRLLPLCKVALSGEDVKQYTSRTRCINTPVDNYTMLDLPAVGRVQFPSAPVGTIFESEDDSKPVAYLIPAEPVHLDAVRGVLSSPQGDVISLEIPMPISHLCADTQTKRTMPMPMMPSEKRVAVGREGNPTPGNDIPKMVPGISYFIPVMLGPGNKLLPVSSDMYSQLFEAKHAKTKESSNRNASI